MSVDAWKNWMRRWRNTPSRRVSPRRAGLQTESLEERALLGELVPSALPPEASELAQVEVAAATIPPAPVDSTALSNTFTFQSNSTSTLTTDDVTSLGEVTDEQPLTTSAASLSSGANFKASS